MMTEEHPTDLDDMSVLDQTLGGAFEEQDASIEKNAIDQAIEEEQELTLEERLLNHLPVGPPPESFDCRVVDSFISPIIEGRDPHCVLNPQCERDLVVAHRGAGGNLGYLAPENSLSAIRAALYMGVDGVELDVRSSLDDQLILMHDASLDRTSDHQGAVEAQTWPQLQQIRLQPPPLHHPQREVGDFSCDYIPSLREALALTKGHLFVDLDMKTDRVDLLLPLLIELDMLDDVYVSVSNPAVAAQARQLDQRVRVQVRPDTLEELREIQAQFEELGAIEIFEVPADLLTQFVTPVQEQGGRLFTDAWAADFRAQIGDLSAYLALFNQGAEIIQSEYPLAVLQALDR